MIIFRNIFDFNYNIRLVDSSQQNVFHMMPESEAAFQFSKTVFDDDRQQGRLGGGTVDRPSERSSSRTGSQPVLAGLDHQ
jgi:hypothetical protein